MITCCLLIISISIKTKHRSYHYNTEKIQPSRI
eukprot:UN06825